MHWTFVGIELEASRTLELFVKQPGAFSTLLGNSKDQLPSHLSTGGAI